MLGVTVTKSNTLLQETFQRCRALVILTISNATDGSLNSVRLHEIFCSMKSLLSLECLHISDTINVFGEDLCALHDLLCQNLPKLKDFCLSFHVLIVYFMLLGDIKYEPIQELLCTLLSGKQPTLDCHTVAFRWRNNRMIHTWLVSLRSGVNFQLL